MESVVDSALDLLESLWIILDSMDCFVAIAMTELLELLLDSMDSAFFVDLPHIYGLAINLLV